MNDTLIPVQKLINDLQTRIVVLESENYKLISAMDSAKELILDEIQSLYDTHMYNACGDNSMPLVPLEDAKCAVETFLSTEKD